MDVRIFKFIGRYGAGLSFYDPTNEEAQRLIESRQVDVSNWEDLGIHQIPQSLIDKLGGFEGCGYIEEWASE